MTSTCRDIDNLTVRCEILQKSALKLAQNLFTQTDNRSYTPISSYNNPLDLVSGGNINNNTDLRRFVSYMKEITKLRKRVMRLEERQMYHDVVNEYNEQSDADSLHLKEIVKMSHIKTKRAQQNEQVKKLEKNVDKFIERQETNLDVQVIMDSMVREMNVETERENERLQLIYDSMRQEIINTLSHPVMVNQLQLTNEKKTELAEMIISNSVGVSRPSSLADVEKDACHQPELPPVPRHSPTTD